MKKKSETKTKGKRGRPKKTTAESGAPPTRQRAYSRAIHIIVGLCEDIVDGTDDINDPRLLELGQLRKQVTDMQNEVLGRLIPVLYVGGKDIDIDEATPGAKADWS